MPARRANNPNGLSEEIRQWLKANPGNWRVKEVADGLGIPEHLTRSQWIVKVGRALSQQARTDRVTRMVTNLPASRATHLTLYTHRPQVDDQ